MSPRKPSMSDEISIGAVYALVKEMNAKLDSVVDRQADYGARLSSMESTLDARQKRTDEWFSGGGTWSRHENEHERLKAEIALIREEQAATRASARAYATVAGVLGAVLGAVVPLVLKAMHLG